MTRGRPRSTAVDDAVAAAVRDELAHGGYPALTVERVAQRAGVAKTAIYRRWPSKAEMVFATAVHGAHVAPPADTGSLAGDVHALAARVVELLSSSAAGAALPGVLAELAHDPALATRFERDVIGAQRDVVRAVLERGIDRGELDAPLPDDEVADIHAVLLGTAFARLHLGTGAVPPDLAGRVARAVLAVITDRRAS